MRRCQRCLQREPRLGHREGLVLCCMRTVGRRRRSGRSSWTDKCPGLKAPLTRTLPAPEARRTCCINLAQSRIKIARFQLNAYTVPASTEEEDYLDIWCSAILAISHNKPRSPSQSGTAAASCKGTRPTCTTGRSDCSAGRTVGRPDHQVRTRRNGGGWGSGPLGWTHPRTDMTVVNIGGNCSNITLSPLASENASLTPTLLIYKHLSSGYI